MAAIRSLERQELLSLRLENCRLKKYAEKLQQLDNEELDRC